MLEQTKTSQQIYDEWYASLDVVDRELVDNVDVSPDDDYPFEVTGPLSPDAKERGGFYRSEVGWTVAWRPFPPQEYDEALAQEQKARKAAEEHRREERFAHQQAEKQRMDAWMAHHLQEYECITEYSRTEAREGKREHFATGSFGTGVSFSPARLLDYDIWEERYGAALRYWVPAALAEQCHRQQWEEGVQRNGEGGYALSALSRIVSGLHCVGDDLYEWALKTFGVERLVEMARANAPITLSSNHGGDYALASKYYRIPVRVPEPYPSKAFVIGYGDAGCRRGPAQSQEQWERTHREHGWIPLGEEDNPAYCFPTEEDIEQGRTLSANYAQFFSDFA